MASRLGKLTSTPSSHSRASVQVFRDFVTTNRLPETIGYNLAYLGVGIGLVTTSHTFISVGSNWDALAVGFLAAMLSKMQASVADAIHDRDLDRENPEKSRLPTALDRLGSERALTILVAELIGGIALWGWIAVSMHAPICLGFGATMCLLGFICTYPPRIKERGLLNHLTTTVVDVGCIAVFVSLGGGTSVGYRNSRCWPSCFSIRSAITSPTKRQIPTMTGATVFRRSRRHSASGKACCSQAV